MLFEIYAFSTIGIGASVNYVRVPCAFCRYVCFPMVFRLCGVLMRIVLGALFFRNSLTCPALSLSLALCMCVYVCDRSPSTAQIEWSIFLGIAAATTLPAVLMWYSSASSATAKLTSKKRN
jgi:hypothetical protein